MRGFFGPLIIAASAICFVHGADTAINKDIKDIQIDLKANWQAVPYPLEVM